MLMLVNMKKKVQFHKSFVCVCLLKQSGALHLSLSYFWMCIDNRLCTSSKNTIM